jgi:hypothetical protein
VIEVETLRKDTEAFYVFRFVWDDDGEYERTVIYGVARDSYDSKSRIYDMDTVTRGRREWTTGELWEAFRCKSIAWARRRAKIVKEFKELLEEGWRLEIMRVTVEEKTTRTTELAHPLDVVTALGKLV